MPVFQSWIKLLLSLEWLIALSLAPCFLIPGWWSWFALGFLVTLVGLHWLAYGRLSYRSGLDWPVLLVIAGVLIGLACSLDFKLSFSRVWSLVAGLAIYYAVINSLSSSKVAKWGAYSLTVVGVIVALGSLIATDWGRGELVKIPLIYDYLPHLLSNSFGSGASSEQEINPRVVAGALIMLLPTIWLAGWRQDKARPVLKKLQIGAGLFLTFVLLLTQAPTAVAGLLAGTGCLWLLVNYKRFPKAWLIAGGVAAGAAIIGTGLGVLWLAHLLPPADADPTQRIVFRLEMWTRTLAMLVDKPFTGIGLNNFPQSIFVFYPTYSLGLEAHAHNIWLQTAADGGVVGLLGLVAVLLGVVVILRRAWLAHGDEAAIRLLVIGVAVGTAGWLFYGVGESITLAHKPALILWAMWGLVAVPARDYCPVLAKPVKGKLRRSIVLGVALVAGVGVIVIGLSWNVLNLNLAIVQGQRAWLSGEMSAITAATSTLQKAVQNNGVTSAATADLLVHLAAKNNDFGLALDYLKQEVRQDSQDTIVKYIPAAWTLWRTALDQDWANPEIRLYKQWNQRYPDDPISYARLAVGLAQKCDPSANSVLEAGIKRSDSAFLPYLRTYLTSFSC